MSDARDSREPGESPEGRARLEDSLDELTRKADDLLDALTTDPEEAPAEEEKSAEGFPDAERLDEEIRDLDNRLDSLFGVEGDPVQVKEVVAAEPEPEPEPVPEFEVAQDESATAKLPATETPTPPTHGFRPSWMIAAAVLLAALAGGIWLTVFQDSPTRPHDEIVGATLQVSPLQPDPQAQEDPVVASSVTEATVTKPREETPSNIEVASVTVKKPTARPPVAKFEPAPPTVETPITVKPVPEPRPVEVPIPATPAVATAEATPPTIPDPAPSMLAPALAVESSTADARHSPISFPTATGFQSAAAVDRREPDWPADAETSGQPMTIVLKVLISEKGRVVRVVVEEGVSDSRLEAAAINAVLRWTYVPATEGGHPVRSWTTERFEF